MQILCIETSKTPPGRDEGKIQKGKMYTSTSCNPHGKVIRGVDMWYQLEETNKEFIHHISLFLPLPSEEGMTFEKRREILTSFTL